MSALAAHEFGPARLRAALVWLVVHSVRTLRAAFWRQRSVTRRAALQLACGALALVALVWSGASHATESPPGLTPRALPGIVRLGLPALAPRGFALATSAAAGYIDPIGAPPVQGARLGGGLAVGFAPIPELSFGLDFSGRLDLLSTPEQNAMAEPRLTARGILFGAGPVRFGLEGDVRFVGMAAPSIDWAATSPSLSALIACVPGGRTWIGTTVGFHLDRSAEAVPDPTSVSAGDRITLGASSAPALRTGIGISHRLPSVPLEVLGEFSADLLLGAAAPPLEQSPLRLTAGARYELAPRLALLASADVALSARPSALSGPTLVPIEPRFGGQLALTWNLERQEEPAPPAEASAPPPPPPPAPPPIARSAIHGRVVDEAGAGLADIEVTLESARGTESVRTLADGRFEFANIEDGIEVRLRAEGPGFDAAQAALGPGAEREAELVLYTAVPAGQVRGTVLDLNGRPVAAKITIDPGNSVLEVRPDGSFNIELAPGEYRLRAEHPDFAPQGRVIVVVERGVVILHIALSP